MSLTGLPYNGAEQSASPAPVATSILSIDDTPDGGEPATSKEGAAKAETQSTKANGLALRNVGSSPTNSGTSANTEVPEIRLQQDRSERSSSLQEGETSWLSRKISKSSPARPRVDGVFEGITLDIPSGGLSDELSTNEMKFSNRGSMLIEGHKVNEPLSTSTLNTRNTIEDKVARSSPSLRAKAPAKTLSTDEETLSQKVRLFYEVGAELPQDADGNLSLGRRMGLRWQDALAGHDGKSTNSVSGATSNSDLRSMTSSIGQWTASTQEPLIAREDNELAGGMEDWQDIKHDDIDRYGFIIPRSQASEQPSGSEMSQPPSSREPQTAYRVSTTLQLLSETPRRKHTIRRSPSSAHGTNGMSVGPEMNKQVSGQPTIRPASSQSAYQGSLAKRNTSLRNASNKLPHNKGRKLMDEASDMLTLPPSMAGIGENRDISSSSSNNNNSASVRLKEIQRERKWQSMARVASKGAHGSGMTFYFDTHSPKLIERTWKGIPDRWRATAWHAFLSASAKKRKDSPSDADLVQAYNEYQTRSSPDDVQIDIDVPRTISSHIMFRRRYRGGQRLLFRVLHAMSLHFAETGYVQGMAALAATLLAYYEEEKAFIMLARLWDLRGLDKLYKEGFGGLTEALDNFEKRWLGQGEIAAKLVRLQLIYATAMLTTHRRMN